MELIGAMCIGAIIAVMFMCLFFINKEKEEDEKYKGENK